MEQYVKGFQRFHAGEDVRPITSCKFLLYYYYYYYYYYHHHHHHHRLLLLLSMMILITGFTCPPTIYFKFITKCTSVITKCDSFFYYKVRWSVVTKCDSFFITKCDKCYYKVRQVLQSVTILLQSATGITKCDDY